MNNIQKDKQLLDRRDIYGNYKDISFTSQKMKKVFNDTLSAGLNEYEKEAIDMILHKISRIAHSKKKYIDNWRDIIGYAQLVINEYEKNPDAIDSKTIYSKLKNTKEFICSAD